MAETDTTKRMQDMELELAALKEAMAKMTGSAGRKRGVAKTATQKSAADAVAAEAADEEQKPKPRRKQRVAFNAANPRSQGIDLSMADAKLIMANPKPKASGAVSSSSESSDDDSSLVHVKSPVKGIRPKAIAAMFAKMRDEKTFDAFVSLGTPGARIARLREMKTAYLTEFWSINPDKKTAAEAKAAAAKKRRAARNA